MPTNAAVPAADGAAPFRPPADNAGDTLPFPADVSALRLSPPDWARGGVHTLPFQLSNPHHAVLHVRLVAATDWLAVTPGEVALGPGETQRISVRANTDAARQALQSGGGPKGAIRLSYQRLFPGMPDAPAPPPGEGSVYLHLPVALCPHCGRTLEGAIADAGGANPALCPFCFERLRPCPVCGTLNSWLARRCIVDKTHVVRASPDWPGLGGDPSHTGSLGEGASAPALSLSRRWTYPNVPPARRENALGWSAPAAAYGLVAASAATAGGEAFLFGFDALTGATLWEPYPLPAPVYPDRGGVALAGGYLYAATVEGTCVGVDALRGTRIWETRPGGGAFQVYGAVVPVGDALFVAGTNGAGGGTCFALDRQTGATRWQATLSGVPDTAPAWSEGRVFLHDDGGTLTALDAQTGAVLWRAACEAGFDAAPVVRDGQVFSATSAGRVWCHEAATGKPLWDLVVTNVALAGTPAHDGALIYLPSDDGLHLVSATSGRAVRRYPLRQPVRSAPVVLGGAVVWGATDGTVYGVGAGRGMEKLYETVGVGSKIVAAPAFADGAFFVTATNGVLYALSLGVSPKPDLGVSPKPDGGTTDVV